MVLKMILKNIIPQDHLQERLEVGFEDDSKLKIRVGYILKASDTLLKMILKVSDIFEVSDIS